LDELLVMTKFDRRTFITALSTSAGSLILPKPTLLASISERPETPETACWLEVTAPLVLQDSDLGIYSEIVLTSDNFTGRDGHLEARYKTDYEILLFESNGKAIGKDGVAKRLTVPAMRTTVIPVRDIIGENKNFFGGMTVRLRPQSPVQTHTSDLFSSAYIRLDGRNSFDNVHANPDPIQWQRPDSFFYSMPFPSLDEYDCVYCIFNPYRELSIGSVSIFDALGIRFRQIEYNLRPRGSMLIDVRRGKVIKDLKRGLSRTNSSSVPDKSPWASGGGTIAVLNNAGAVKNFGYLMISRLDGSRFSLDHPIHQSPFAAEKKPPPFDAAGQFKVKNILYTPLVFRRKRIGDITLESKFHLSSGNSPEDICG
jgi:hypothetical protein